MAAPNAISRAAMIASSTIFHKAVGADTHVVQRRMVAGHGARGLAPGAALVGLGAAVWHLWMPASVVLTASGLGGLSFTGGTVAVSKETIGPNEHCLVDQPGLPSPRFPVRRVDACGPNRAVKESDGLGPRS